MAIVIFGDSAAAAVETGNNAGELEDIRTKFPVTIISGAETYTGVFHFTASRVLDGVENDDNDELVPVTRYALTETARAASS
jgi:hypothetical protein